jgi:hypothetical protein
MIPFLASIFRRLSYIVGITAPPPGENERPFVFYWLSMIVISVVGSAVLIYVILRMGVP